MHLYSDWQLKDPKIIMVQKTCVYVSVKTDKTPAESPFNSLLIRYIIELIR